MEYGAHAWYASKDVAKLEEIQNKTLSTCVGIEKGWHRALEGELGLDNLTTRREKTLLKYYLKASKMTGDRIPKRILNRKWPRNKSKFSTLNKMKSILRKWKLMEPEELEATMVNDEGIHPSPKALKQKWKETLDNRSHEYMSSRNRNDSSVTNSKYRHAVPNRKGPKSYLTNFNKKARLKLRVLAETKKSTCPLCRLQNVPLAEHMLTFCSSTVKERRGLLKRLRINTKRYNLREARTFLHDIFQNEKSYDNYLGTAAEMLEFAENKINVQKMEPHEFIGKIIDIRQDEKWYRTRVIHYCHENDSLIIDSENLDEWPFKNYQEFDLNQCRDGNFLIDNQCAIILRSSNALSFSNLENNAGKTIFVKGHPIQLQKCIAGGKYTTTSGSRINLEQLIKNGDLNACILNGVVARRYESTNRCESNAVRYGKP
jgi:hypothetical protein